VEGPAVSRHPANHVTLATPLPLSSRPERSEAEGSAVRPAALSNPSSEALQDEPSPLNQAPCNVISLVAGHRTRLANKISAARSTHPVIWTASDWNNRAHFIGLAATSREKLDEVEELDVALKKLEMENPRQARVIELRYFGGLPVEQIGALLEIAPRSVKRDWAPARIWLFRELRPEKNNFRNCGPFLGAVPP
jgi:hypothetical protein